MPGPETETRTEEPDLEALRTAVDQVDTDILAAVNRRAELARSIARVKGDAGDSEDFYRPDREAMVLRSLERRNAGPLSNDHVARIFREIMSACLALQKPLSVAYLGPEGTFTEVAALKHFGYSVQARPLDTIDAVFREVESGGVQYGVVPVENSTEGVVSHTLDRFVTTSLGICGELELRIQHNLLGSERELARIVRVYAHHQALAQCRRWLDLNLPSAERVTVSSNGEAARRVTGEPSAAAIAGDVAADTYDLNILASGIEDEPENSTRFLIVGHRRVPATGMDKTSLLLSAENRPGALYGLLEPLARHGISMTRIESRPSRRGNWSYVFFVDIEGHRDDERVATALVEIGDNATLYRVLGSYPRATT